VVIEGAVDRDDSWRRSTCQTKSASPATPTAVLCHNHRRIKRRSRAGDPLTVASGVELIAGA
jgi:hypothetical protein